MFSVITPPLLALLLAWPGLPKLPIPGLSDLKKLRQKAAAPLDSLPPAWKPVSRLALENQFILATLPAIPSGPVGIKLNNDPRQVHVSFDADSGVVRYTSDVGEFTIAEPTRLPIETFTRDITRRSFDRIWAERNRNGLLGPAASATNAPTPGGGLRFEFPSPLPSYAKGIFGSGNPSLTVSGSENIRLSGTSNWSNSQSGLALGQKRSLFPSLDMQQDLDIRLEGRLSDRVGVNLLQNSANQIPLANRIAINYKGDEDDLVQALDLGNTNLSLPGTQYVSYSGKNEGLFGMKATTRLGPLDFTILASRQEGRSERAGYQGGSSQQDQFIADKDYVKGVYFFLYDPNTNAARAIDEGTIKLYLKEGFYSNDANLERGRAFVDPASPCIDSTLCPDGPGDTDTNPDTTAAVHGKFRQLRLGADLDFEVLTDIYGPLYMVIRLRSALTSESQALAVTYNYRNVDGNGQPIGDVIPVGGQLDVDTDGVNARRMMLLRAPTEELKPQPGNPDFFDTTRPFYPTRELELKNFYQLSGQRIAPESFQMALRRGDDQPPQTTVQDGVPYIEAVGLDNHNEAGGPVSALERGHDGVVDGTVFDTRTRAFIDWERGTLFLPDPRPFAPRLDGTRPFDQFVSNLLFRRDSLVGAPGTRNEANPAIYDKRNVLSTDRTYTIEVRFTAARIGNEITLGRTNIIEGSDVVTINDQTLTRGRDYNIDYDLGRVTLIRQLGPTDRLNIDYSYAPLFAQAGRTLIGNAFRWEGRDKSFGGAFMYESKGAQDQRPRLGEEPSRVMIGDLNTEWRFKPNWVTRMVDFLPLVRTSTPSELNIQAEVGGSLPNPNTKNEIFIDDMEGVRDAVSLSLGPERWNLTSIPQRTDTRLVNDPFLPDSQRNAELHWYAPLNVVHERDLKPTLDDAQGAMNSRQVLALSIPRRPANTIPDQPLWTGLTYLLDPYGIDLTRSQFIEIWVNDFRDFHDNGQEFPVDRVRGKNVKLHIDLGKVSEDQQRAPNILPNGELNTEDVLTRLDQQLTVNDELNEDTGVDSLTDVRERELLPPLSPKRPDLTTSTDSDPQGDDFEQPATEFKDWDPRKWRRTNGEEGNRAVVPIPDTEDLNADNQLQVEQTYFEYTIDLGDAASPYLVTDVYKFYTTPPQTGQYRNDGDQIPRDNGWRRYRIPIGEGTPFGAPDLRFARHVRVWLEDVTEVDPPALAPDDGRPLVVIGGIEIVGSRWVASDLDSTSGASGTTMTLNSVNSVDNAEVYKPPFDPGETRSGNQGVTRREQSIAMEFTQLNSPDTLEAYKTFSLDEDYSRYGKLDFYAAALEVPTYNPDNDALDYFVRFASDEKGSSYYEYRSRMPPSSTAGGSIQWRKVSLTLTDLSNLKLRPDFPTTGEILYRAPGKAPNEEYVIKGRPSFTRLRRISFGIINASGRAFPSGQLWIDELRGADIAKDQGLAQRVNVNGRFANLMTYNLAWNGRDENFQSVGETRGVGSSTNALSFQSAFDLHRFFESTRILLPINYSYTSTGSQPRYTAGDDVVRTGLLAEGSDTHSETRTYSASYSRAWSDRTNPFLKYTIAGLSANISHARTDGRNPISTDDSRSTQAAVNYSIAPRQAMKIPLPLTRATFFPLPERFYWNYSVQKIDATSFQRLPDTSGALILLRSASGRQAGLNFGADSRPFDFFHHSFNANRNLSLPGEVVERVGGVNMGRVTNWSQQMDARLQLQRYGPWLNPNLSWNARYGQNNDLTNLAVRGITNNQTITVNWSLPFDQLKIPRTTVVDTSRARRGVALWRRLLSRLGPVTTDASFNSGSGHSRMRGTPDFMYLMGFKQDPGFSDTTADVHTEFGNRSDESTEWRTGGNTRLDLGFGATVMTRGDYSERLVQSNGVPNKSNRVRFPEFDFEYGRIPELLGLKTFLVNPRLKSAYSRSQSIDFVNSDDPTSVSASSQWSPLLELAGDLKNGTRCLARLERRITQTENHLLGHSITTDRNTNLNFSLNRSYSKGQKVTFLGKETTVRSNVNLGLSGAYERRSGETKQQGLEGVQNKVSTDRVSVNAQGGYSFSNNLTGNLELGFGQNRNLMIGQINRSIRVELRAQFTF